MELRQFFLEKQQGRLTREQQVLTDEFRLMVDKRTQMTLGDLIEADLLRASTDSVYRMAEFEIATFFISWMEMIIFSGLDLTTNRRRELEITLLSVRMTFCLNMKDRGIGGVKPAEYWMDKLVGRCRQYWARMDLNDPKSQARNGKMLLTHLAPYLDGTREVREIVFRGIEEKLRDLVDMVNMRMSRHGFRKPTLGKD